MSTQSILPTFPATSPIHQIASSVASPDETLDVIRTSGRAQSAYLTLCATVGVEPRL